MATKEELEKRRNELEMEDLEDRIQQRRQQKAVGKMTHESQEQALEVSRRTRVSAQRRCPHKKGGVDLKGIREGGNDSNYSIWRIRMPDGRIMQHCSRCPATWVPGDTAKTHPTGIGYRTVLAWPTDNTMAETAQFRFERIDKRAQKEEADEEDAA